MWCGCCTKYNNQPPHNYDHQYQALSMNGSSSPNSNLPPDHELLLVTDDNTANLINLTLNEHSLTVTRRKLSHKGINSTKDFNKASSNKSFPYLQVLSAKATRELQHATPTRVSLAAIYTPPKGHARLWQVQGQVHEVGHDRERREQGHCRVEKWCQSLMDKAYQGVKPNRRLRVIINKHGGKGQAYELWNKIVKPIFKAANCSVIEEETGPASSEQNARNLGRNHDCSAFDALVPISGDGITHELLNGLASRPDAVHALQSTPIVPIPAGSGNALQLNLEGPQHANDCAWAALAAVKGTIVPLDLCSVSQNGQRYYSFLSQAFGLMADLDLGTEHLRWMGDARFVFGFLQGALTKRKYPVELSLKIIETNKKALAEIHNAELDSPAPPVDKGQDLVGAAAGPHSPMPSVQFGTEQDPIPRESSPSRNELPMELQPGWHTLTTDVSFVYAGKMPFVSRDAMLFPPASAQNGLIDVAIMSPSSRMEALSGLDGAAEGKVFYNKHIRYYRCEAYRLTPLAPTGKGYISIDGESVPFSPFQVECHQALARCLTLGGKFHRTPMALSG